MKRWWRVGKVEWWGGWGGEGEQGGVLPRAPASRRWDHEWQDGTARAAAVMHVTSMRPSQDNFGMGASFPSCLSNFIFHCCRSPWSFFFIFVSPTPLICFFGYSSIHLSAVHSLPLWSLQTHRIRNLCGLFVQHKQAYYLRPFM